MWEGLHQTKMCLHRQRNNQQNEEAVYGLIENIHKSYKS
jgi:hypothetical protein